METASEIVRKLFDDYERGIRTSDPELLSSLYEDSFVFAGPRGVQAVKREDLLRALPRQQESFRAVGLTSSKVRALEETRLDEYYVMVKTSWEMQIEKGQGQSAVVEASATYILHRHGDLLRIAFQLDHQDLMERVRGLGSSPAKD
jgi:hypothetical protein